MRSIYRIAVVGCLACSACAVPSQPHPHAAATMRIHGQEIQSTGKPPMTYKEITPQQASAALAQDSTRFIDVRTVGEFNAGHVPGAVNIPIFVMSPAGEMMPNPKFVSVVQRYADKDATLIVGCKMGGRSAQAAEVLCHLGYGNVSNMLGGFSGHPQHPGWQSLGLPVERQAPPRNTFDSLCSESD